MSTLEHLSHNLREGLDSLAEGWQHLWQKTRQAITRFTPSDSDAAEKILRLRPIVSVGRFVSRRV